MTMRTKAMNLPKGKPSALTIHELTKTIISQTK